MFAKSLSDKGDQIIGLFIAVFLTEFVYDSFIWNFFTRFNLVHCIENPFLLIYR